MANHDNDRWIDDRLAGLAADRWWNPNAGRAFAQLQARRRPKAPRTKRWIWTTLAAGCAYFTLLMLPSSHACAQQPGPCVLRALGVAGHSELPVLEIYMDHQSPECEAFFRNVAPQLTELYVQTGKLRLVFKDHSDPATSGYPGRAPYAVLVRNGSRQTITESPLSLAVLRSRLE